MIDYRFEIPREGIQTPQHKPTITRIFSSRGLIRDASALLTKPIMTTQQEFDDLVRATKAQSYFDEDGRVRVKGIEGIGPHPMSLLSAVEKLRDVVSRKAGAAVLGFRGAIRCCRAAGLDEEMVFRLVQKKGCD